MERSDLDPELNSPGTNRRSDETSDNLDPHPWSQEEPPGFPEGGLGFGAETGHPHCPFQKDHCFMPLSSGWSVLWQQDRGWLP